MKINLRSDAVATNFFVAFILRLLFKGSYCSSLGGQCLFLWEACRHQRWLDKIRTSDTAMTVRRCQQLAQPLSPAVSRGNELYSMNSPSTSLVSVVRSQLAHVCMRHVSSQGYSLRTVFISLRASECVAIVRGRHLLEKIQQLLQRTDIGNDWVHVIQMVFFSRVECFAFQGS